MSGTLNEVSVMYYVGIDSVKLNHNASALSSDGEVLIKPFKFSNDNDGFCKLLSALDPFDCNCLIIVLKSTEHYGNNLLEFIVSNCFLVCLINLLQMSTMRKNNIRKTGTDKVDALIIAKTLMTHHRFVSFAGLDSAVYQFGKFKAGKTRMSKLGSRILQYAQVVAARNVVNNNATFNAYYYAKITEGRTHYNALRALCKRTRPNHLQDADGRRGFQSRVSSSPKS